MDRECIAVSISFNFINEEGEYIGSITWRLCTDKESDAGSTV